MAAASGEAPNKYEQAIDPAPLPADWVHLKVEVSGKTISAYVDHNKKASLVVNKLNDINKGEIGLWVGTDSNGEFSNLSVRKK